MCVKISVITVSFNSEKTIAETIDSVLEQDYKKFDYTIIDGNSTDNTVKISESYKDKFAAKGIDFRIISEKDNGIYDAMNKGIKMTQGEIVGIINSDDYYQPGALSKVAAFYEKENFDLMYADLRIFGNGKEYIKRARLDKKFTTRHWNHPTTFVTRKVYLHHLYAIESIYDDLDFMLKARAAGFKICVLNEVLASFRLGGVSNKKKLALCCSRIKLRNSIYKKDGCKGYRLDNFIIEFGKYLLS